LQDFNIKILNNINQKAWIGESELVIHELYRCQFTNEKAWIYIHMLRYASRIFNETAAYLNADC
jgi:hypothetical protein